jgi:hypothetical protein
MRHMKKHHFFILFGLILTTILAFINSAWAASQGGDKNGDEMHEYLRVHCQLDSKFISSGDNFVLCDSMFQGGYGVSLESKNSIGIQPSGDSGSPGAVKGRPAGNVTTGGGSSWGAVSGGDEDIGLGILLTDLSSDTERQGTELENGFDSKLDGYLLGLDYQMFDSLIVGATFGSIEDKADLAADGGGFKTESDSKTLYATWVPLENLSLDLYYGAIDLDTNSMRNFNFTSPTLDMKGVITGLYKGEQTINGVSINYDWYIGSWSLGAFVNSDRVTTNTDGYSEEGLRTNHPGPNELPGSPEKGDPTGFELRYPDQEVKSATQSVGLRFGYSVDFGWGVLLPSLTTMSVRENEADARVIPVAFASTPDDITPFTVETDEPDRNYTTSSFGIIAAFNNGSQIFLDYEERAGHDFIDTNSVTLGALIAF